MMSRAGLSRWTMFRPSRRVALGGAVAVGLLLGAILSAGPIARARIDAVARALGLRVTVGSLRPGWFAVDLANLEVTPVGATFGSARLGSLRVSLGLGFGVQALEGHGLEVDLRGAPGELEGAIADWVRSRGGGDGKRSSSPAPVSVDGVALDWRDREAGRSLGRVTGGAISRGPAGWRVAFEEGTLGTLGPERGAQVHISAGLARFDSHGVLLEGSASRVAVAWESGRSSSTVAAAPPPEPAPPPLPVVAPKSGKGGSASAIPPEWRLPLPEPRHLRAKLVALGAVARDRLAPDAHLTIDALAFELRDHDHRLSVGQGPLSLTREASAVSVRFRTKTDAHGTPLELDATLPLNAGDAVVSLAGGPISLTLLGVDEGAAGLTDIDRTTVAGEGRMSLSASGDALTFDARVGVRGLALQSPRLAAEIVRGVDATLVARGVLDDRGTLRLDDGEVTLGTARALARGTLAQTADHLAASMSLELPATPCESLLQSVPSALIPTLFGAEMTGSFGAKGRLAFDSANLDDLVLDWAIDDRCAMAVVPEGLARERFAQPFEHTVYEPDGSFEVITTGPTTEAWSDLEHISPFMQVAVLTTEDGAFFRHHGFNRAAIRNALVANIKAGRFVRGASTITMQLAKNLFLSREKTLSRKLEELVLADYLESAFTKQEMMELYLNVIEFGPGVYGVTQAADHYFGRKPSELNLAECLFLSSLLPSPLRYSKLADKPTLSESWAKHLRDLMNIAAKIGTISPEELEEGAKEVVSFRDPKGAPPPPRTPITSTHFTRSRAPDAEWEATP